MGLVLFEISYCKIIVFAWWFLVFLIFHFLNSFTAVIAFKGAPISLSSLALRGNHLHTQKVLRY